MVKYFIKTAAKGELLMKKRWAMGLLCCLLLFQLAFPAKAAGSVYFVAAEESVLPVTDATMPFWANGYLYVPASVFTNLGISVINNTAKKMTVLEKDRRAMLFDWAKGTAQDSSGSLFIGNFRRPFFKAETGKACGDRTGGNENHMVACRLQRGKLGRNVPYFFSIHGSV